MIELSTINPILIVRFPHETTHTAVSLPVVAVEVSGCSTQQPIYQQLNPLWRGKDV